MVNITLKDIPEKLHRKLKARARRNGRSLNKEAILCLEGVVEGEAQSALSDAGIKDGRQRGPR